MIITHSKLQISNYMQLIGRNTARLYFVAYSREELNKNLDWGAGRLGRGIQGWS